jgi:hypothetical protein
MTSSTPNPPTSPAGGGDLIYPQQPPKDPVMILLANLVGIGYFMIGQKTKGIVAIVLWLLGLLTCGIGTGIVALVAALDGYFQAQQLQQGHPIGQWTFFQDHR